MDPLVLSLVLAAAVLHASWNALVKSAGDPWVQLGIAKVATVGFAVAFLPFVSFPDADAWPYLLASAAIHQVYYVFVSLQYRFGDLSHVYPLSRGSAPLLVAAGAFLFAGETLNSTGILAVIIISLAILSLTLGTPWKSDDGKGAMFALGTGTTIAFYTVFDGLGGRTASDVFGYIIYLFILEGIPFGLLVAFMRRRVFRASFREHWKKGILGGALSFFAYGLVIWAMSITPMTYVSALRETSVILAALIGTRMMGEPFGARRITAAACVAVGVILLQISKG